MSTLQLKIEQRVLSATDLKQIFSGTENIDQIHVTFDSEWNSFDHMAVFSRNGTDCFFVDVDSSGNALIPAPILEESGTILIGIVGEKGKQRLTSSLLKYRVGEGACVSDLLDPNTVRSLMDLINEALADVGGITGTHNGYTFTPSVSADGVISWTNNGGLENPPSVNIKGPDGIGVRSITAYYARSASGTTAPTSGYSSTTLPTLTTTYRYMWSYLRFTLTNNQTRDTAKTVIGVYGNTGPEGPMGPPGTGGSSLLALSQCEGTSAGGDFIFPIPDGANELFILIKGAGSFSFSMMPVNADGIYGTAQEFTTSGRYPYVFHLRKFDRGDITSTTPPYRNGWLLTYGSETTLFYDANSSPLASLRFPAFPAYTYVELFYR